MVGEMLPCNTQVCEDEANSEVKNRAGDDMGYQLIEGLVKELMRGDEAELVKVARKFRQLVSSDSHNNADAVVRAGCLSKFVDLLHRDDDWQLQNESAWVLCNVAGAGVSQSRAVVKAGALPGLVHLLACTMEDVRLSAVWAIVNISGHDPAAKDLMLDNNAIPNILPLLKEKATLMVKTAVWALRNLCRAAQPSTPAFCKLAPCLPALADLITHSDSYVGSYACWALADVGHIYGSLLLTSLTPAFSDALHRLQNQYPGRSAVRRLAEVVGNMDSPKDVSTEMIAIKEEEVSRLEKKVWKGEPTSCITPKRKRESPDFYGVITRSVAKRQRKSRQSASPEPSSACPLRVPGQTPPSRLAHTKVELWKAVEAGDVEQVAQLVQETGPAVTRGKSGCTLLHVAAANNQPEVVEWLLQLLSPNLVNKAGLTPTHLAAMKGHTQVLRLLLDDPHLDHLARDPTGNTYRHWLVQPLFEAVLDDDKERTRSLLRVGADPDLDGGRMVGGALVSELQVTTARHLATILHHQHILKIFDKTQSAESNTHNQAGQAVAFGSIPVALSTSNVGAEVGLCVPDVYERSGAVVTILSYASFPGQPHLDLPTSHTGAHNLASVFTKMGYSGHVHMDLTEQQTRQVLTQVRDMEELDRIGCAIFVVASHGTQHQHFLTSDGHLLDTRWLCDLFKDSQCPRLTNKPKLFIFDLCCGHYRQQGDEKKGRGQDTRVEEPLRDTVCLYSNSGELTWYSSSKDGTLFSSSLCHTLTHHDHLEFGDLYRQFLIHHSSMAPTAAPYLHNAGFTKKFYFISASSTS